MRRYLQSDMAWWASMMPAFCLAVYFVLGWVRNRDQPSVLLSAIGALAVGVLITCWMFARQEAANAQAECERAPAAKAACAPEPVHTESSKEISMAPTIVSGPQPAWSAPEQPPVSPWMAKGLDFAHAKQYRDALYCFSYVLQSDPGNQAALTAKGECLMKMNRPEEALKAFMQAAKIDQDSPLAQEGKAALIRRVRATTWM
jgi:tetratricopeptide (TPR) repeat protein